MIICLYFKNSNSKEKGYLVGPPALLFDRIPPLLSECLMCGPEQWLWFDFSFHPPTRLH